MNKHLIYLIITMVCALHARAQTANQSPIACATTTPFANRTPIPQEALVKLNATSDYQYVVRIYVHICRDDDGSNAAVTLTQMNIEIQRMANFFKPRNICFQLVGQDYYDNTEVNNKFNYSNAAHVNAIQAYNNKTDAMNIFVHAGNMVDNDGKINAGGYCYNIPGLLYSVCQPSSFNWYHEMGHALGLLHTFDTGNGVECPGGGTGCDTKGDLICDTEADFPDSEDAPRTGCTYTGTKKITCNGLERGYNPPVNNIMSYWYTCYTQFTADQGIRMRYFLASTTSPENVLQPAVAASATNIGGLFGSTNNITTEIGRAATTTINIGNLAFPNSGDVIMAGNVKGVINSGNVVLIKPGTTIRCAAANKVDIVINTICD